MLFMDWLAKGSTHQQLRFLSMKIVGLSTHPNAKENERGKLFYCFVLIVSL
jgi:hypothetical protein